jgi:transposase
MPKKRFIVTLTPAERDQLEAMVSKGKAAAYRIKHANIVLAADENGANMKDDAVATALRCHRNTVANVRQRFVEQGLDAALERKKRDAPAVARKLDGRGEARLIAIACGTPPEGRAKWTMQLLADELVALGVVDSISDETVRTTLKKTNSSRICGNVG